MSFLTNPAVYQCILAELEAELAVKMHSGRSDNFEIDRTSVLLDGLRDLRRRAEMGVAKPWRDYADGLGTVTERTEAVHDFFAKREERRRRLEMVVTVVADSAAKVRPGDVPRLYDEAARQGLTTDLRVLLNQVNTPAFDALVAYENEVVGSDAEAAMRITLEEILHSEPVDAADVDEWIAGTKRSVARVLARFPKAAVSPPPVIGPEENAASLPSEDRSARKKF